MTMTYQWSIFQAVLDPTLGREQAGERPVIVISAEPLNAHYDVVTVIPVTSRKNNRPVRLGHALLPAGTGGLPLESFALCYQMRILDKARLGKVYGTIDDPTVRQEIHDVIALCLDID